MNQHSQHHHQQQQQSNQMNKVVSLRNIPNDISDLQIALMGLQFGEVVNILYIKGKGQVSDWLKSMVDCFNVCLVSWSL